MNLLLFNLAVDRHHVTLAFSLGWIRELAKRFDHVDVVTMRTGEYDLPSNVAVWSVGLERGYPEWLRAIRFYMIVARIVHKRRIAVVFTHMIPIFAVLFWPVAKLLRLKNVMWYAHGSTPRTLKVAHRLVDRVVSSTPEGFRLPSSKVEFIGQGFDNEIFRWSERPSSMVRSYITVGRLARSKSIEMMIEAVTAIPDNGGTLTVVGGATSPDEESYAQDLAKTAASLIDPLRVRFTGRAEPEEAYELLCSHDVFINLSETGSLDKAIVEAMASGCIVVSTNTAFATIAREEGFPQCIPVRHDNAAVRRTLDEIASLSPTRKRELALRQSEVANKHGRPRLIDKLSDILRSHAK